MQVIFHKQFGKAIAKIPAADAKRIVQSAKRLEKPWESNLDIAKLKGREGYRLRVGNYRIFFSVEGDKVKITNLVRKSTTTYN